MVLQAVLSALVLMYVAYRLRQIFTDDPPVDVSTDAWRGVGKWALCPNPGAPNPTLYAAGFALLAGRWIGLQYSSSYEKIESGWPLPRETVSWANGTRFHRTADCAIVDLTTWAPPHVPTSFVLALDAHNSYMLIESHGEWVMTAWGMPGTMTVLRLNKRIHGEDLGYHTSTVDFYETSVAMREEGAGPDFGTALDMTIFNSGSAGHKTVTLVAIDEPLVTKTLKLGIVVQLANFISGIGGYLTVVTLVFTTAFVKKYPQCDVALAYEQRTLRGNQEAGNPSNRATGAVPTEIPAGAVSYERQGETAGTTATNIPRDLVRGQRQETPLLPPGLHPAPQAFANASAELWQEERKPRLPERKPVPLDYRPTE